MNVTSNPVIYCLEGSVQFFLPDQIAHFLEKEAKIFQHMDYSHPSSSTLGSTHICWHPEDPTFSLLSPLPPLLDMWQKKNDYYSNEKVQQDIKGFLIRFW